ncbi:hydroxymethylglutaryl-CoA synthase [Patescibacteria group bacterium]|nr:hydroxymethylglutaryl-CoA synthase [Patescibacteria group bacterium]
MKIGIISYGAYIPKYRVTTEEIAGVWGKNAEEIARGLFVSEKSVPGLDEDTITIAHEASRQALDRVAFNPRHVDALFVGSESHPYAVKPSSVTVAKALGVGTDYYTADLEFACKAGSAGMQIVSSFVSSKKARTGLAIGADTAQGKPGDALEYTAAAGGAAFLIGSDDYEHIATIDDYVSYTSDTPDFWRSKHGKYPHHAERFTGKPAYFKHIFGATTYYLEKNNYSPSDFDSVIFHMPNGKFPRTVARALGFTEDQLSDSLVVDFIGNTYSGSSLLGLARVLDSAKPGDRILMTSYGSGSGSDTFSFTVTDAIEKMQTGVTVNDYIEDKIYLSYGEYAKHVGTVN